MIKQFIKDGRVEKGFSYEDFMKKAEEKIEDTDESKLDEKEKQLFEYTKLNLHRSKRIDKTYKVSDELKNKIENIKEKQYWMVLTEDWCGDSAQNLPYVAKMASLNNNIVMKILPRDENLDIMDQYLTNGKSRSIPKLVAFNEDGEEIFQLGPRPKELADLVKKWKDEGEDFKEKIHLWYGRNRGKAIEAEFVEIL